MWIDWAAGYYNPGSFWKPWRVSAQAISKGLWQNHWITCMCMLKNYLFQQKLGEMLYQSTGIKLCCMVLASIKNINYNLSGAVIWS